MLNNQLPPDTYPAYVQGMSADPPVVKRVPVNKSGKGTHLTTIRDQGECGPEIVCVIEYDAKHSLPLGAIEVELGRVIEVFNVYVTPVCYGQRSVIKQHPMMPIECSVITEPWWIDTANVLLTEHVALAERIEDEIRAKLAG